MLITEAEPSQAEQHAARKKRYAITMGIRGVCIVLAAVFYQIVWLMLIFAVLGTVLPWIAVVMANDGPPKKRRATPHRYDARPDRVLESRAHPRHRRLTGSAGARPPDDLGRAGQPGVQRRGRVDRRASCSQAASSPGGERVPRAGGVDDVGRVRRPVHQHVARTPTARRRHPRLTATTGCRRGQRPGGVRGVARSR